MHKDNEWRHVCFGSAPIECPPQTLDNAIMETRPLPTKAIKPSACAWSNGKSPQRTCTKTNFTLLKSAKLPAWHKTTLTTFDANQPTAFVFKLGVAAAVALDLLNCITEEHLPPNVTANDPITDNQQPFVLVDDIRKLLFQIHCGWCLAHQPPNAASTISTPSSRDHTARL